jgi:hypothetical protein
VCSCREDDLYLETLARKARLYILKASMTMQALAQLNGMKLTAMKVSRTRLALSKYGSL